MAAGKHITPDSEREAMVNVQFAKQNNLHIGDKLTITMPGYSSGIEVALSGIYEFVDDADETESSPSELSANFIYVDYDTAFALDERRQRNHQCEIFCCPAGSAGRHLQTSAKSWISIGKNILCLMRQMRL